MKLGVRNMFMICGLLLLVVLAAGCANNTAGDGKSATRVVTTSSGDIEIPANPQRVVVTYHDDIDHLMALGVKPAGVPTYERIGQTDGYLPYLAEELQGVPKLGNVPTPENILSANPDLILAGYSHRETLDDLNKIAPTVYIEWQLDWRETHLEIGRVLGLEQRAQENIDAYNALLEEAKGKLQAAIGDETVAFIRLMPKEVRIHGLGDQVPGYVLYEQLGLTPAAGVPKDSWAETISLEIFAELDVDHIFMHVDEDEESQELAKELLKEPIYRNIPAIRKEQVYFVPNHPWNRGGPLAFEEGIHQVLDALGAN